MKKIENMHVKLKLTSVCVRNIHVMHVPKSPLKSWLTVEGIQ